MAMQGMDTKELVKYKVSFILDQELIPNSKADAFILPNKQKIDKFGYSIGCQIGFKTTNDTAFLFEGVCAVKDVKDLYSFVSKEIREAHELSAEKITEPFRCMLVDVKAYQLVRQALGEERASGIFNALSDIAVASRTSSTWVDFSADPVFALAMIRSSEAFFAFRKGKRVFRGLSTESSDSKQPFSIALQGHGPKYEFDFLFDERNIFRGRIAVLIGSNGCGKTSSLAKIARCLADTKSKVGVITNRPESNQVLAFIHTSAVYDFTPTSKDGSAKVRVFTFNPGSPRKPNADSMTTLLVDVIRGSDNTGRLLDFFTEVFDVEFPELEIMVPVKFEAASNRSSKYVPLATWEKGSEQEVLELSTKVNTRDQLKFTDKEGIARKLSLGQLSFLQFILTVLSNAGPASILIIDEPENFLHPNLISRFMRTLNNILERTNSIAILATHSPFVVREVQSAQVHVMRLQGVNCIVEKPLLQTLGASISSISNDVFGDDLHMHLFDELLERAKRESKTFEEALEKYASELSVSALMMLRIEMESSSREKN